MFSAGASNMRRMRAVSKLLNRPGFHSTAAIACQVEITNWHKHVMAEVHVSDCDRKISLDFDDSTRSDYNNSLHKIDTMIKVLTKFREQFEVACMEAEEARSKMPKRKRRG